MSNIPIIFSFAVIAKLFLFDLGHALNINIGSKNCPPCDCPTQTSRGNININIDILGNKCPPCPASCEPYATFDYIVVGAGSAGSVVATRLAEDRNVSVLLLEAGGEPPIWASKPGFFPLDMFSPYDWKYFTTKQKHTTFGEYWPRGKMLGGTGSMNCALFLRANKRDFETWVGEGCPNWSWDENLPFYKKSENYLGNNPTPSVHGTGGPINVTTVGHDDPTINAFVESAMKYGLKYRDPNDGDQTGVFHMPANIVDQKRQSSYTNYLLAMQRSNLKVETFALVYRILFEQKIASGVLYSRGGNQYKVSARKEVIVCGGTINSPQLLMLSGIGPKDHLSKFKIPVVADLPVGENLADEFVVWNLHSPNLGTVLNPGYLAMANAFFNSKYSNDSNYPDTQMVMFRDYIAAFTFVVSVRSETRGRILLKSTDPRVHPKIEYQYFSDERDLNKQADGLRKSVEILKGMNLIPTASPTCLLYALNDDKYWKCRVTALGSSAWHPIGTCKMGNPSSMKSVVDCNFKVIGVQKLRVVDASVFPGPVSANPQATVFMIAERAAEMIKNSN